LEYRAGRFWHGVETLRSVPHGQPPKRGEELLLLAWGERGWGNWTAVRDLLQTFVAAGESVEAPEWCLFGRAMDATGDPEGADSAYSRALEVLGVGSGVVGEVDEAEMHLWRFRARVKAGKAAAAGEDLAALLETDPSRGRWLALEGARVASGQGLPEATRGFLSSVTPADLLETAWDLYAGAFLAAGDSARAEAEFWAALPRLSSSAERGRAWERVGGLRLARGDSTGAKAAYHNVLRQAPRSSGASEAASALVSLGFDSTAVALTAAEALVRAGEEREAMAAYEAYAEMLGTPLPRSVNLAVARLHLAASEPGRALALLDSLAAAEGTAPPPEDLVLRARTLAALGRMVGARAAQDSLIARFPDRPEAVEVLFLRADAMQNQGNLAGAIEGFRETAALSPAQNLAGQAQMRLGQIFLSQGRDEEAARVYGEYLESFPEGRRWDEAAFWAGRTLLSGAKVEEGEAVLLELRRRFPLSFYSVLSGSLLGLPFAPEVPDPGPRPEVPPEILAGLGRIDALLDSDLSEGVDWEFRRLADTIRTMEEGVDEKPILLWLALEMNARGLTREGINLGWEIYRSRGEWDRRLLAAVYPFPYREMVLREAGERGLDPFLVAGLIRQESAFWKEARSRADARGLMQVLPATGLELARARGPRGFDPDDHLFLPEINLHLGVAFFSDLRRRFGEDLSILLSAYNAGPTRARRWRAYPEAGDLPRFVERIPFAETRGYVKSVLANREIYAWLYGGEEGGSTHRGPSLTHTSQRFHVRPVPRP
jgi:soluble lytic murein transglycosylase